MNIIDILWKLILSSSMILWLVVFWASLIKILLDLWSLHSFMMKTVSVCGKDLSFRVSYDLVAGFHIMSVLDNLCWIWNLMKVLCTDQKTDFQRFTMILFFQRLLLFWIEIVLRYPVFNDEHNCVPENCYVSGKIFCFILLLNCVFFSLKFDSKYYSDLNSVMTVLR